MKFALCFLVLAIGTMIGQNCEISCDPRCTQCHGGGGDLYWDGEHLVCGGCPPVMGGSLREAPPKIQLAAKRFSPSLNTTGVGAALAAEIFAMLRGPRVPLKSAIPAHTASAMQQVQNRIAKMNLLGVQCRPKKTNLALFQ